MSRAALLAFLVGCYSPSYRDCDVTCASGLCPSGFVCDHDVCRVEGFSGACGAVTMDSSMDTNPGDDLDNDGVSNEADNCPNDANSFQDDEDRDGKGDACDPCPPLQRYIMNGQPVDADTDSDGDGVGNGCDPNPTAAGDHIVVFDGFNRMPAAPAMIDQTGGAWSFNGDAIAVTNTPNQRVSIGWPTPTTSFSVQSLTTWTGESGTLTDAGPAAFMPAGANDGWGCMFYNQGGTAPHVLAVLDLPNGAFSSMNLPFEDMLARTLQLAFSQTTFQLTCGMPQGQLIANAPPSTTPNDTFTGVAANGMSARFSWVMILAR